MNCRYAVSKMFFCDFQVDFLGVTKVQDLSPVDQDKLHSIALLELTSLFDEHCIEPTRQKPRKRYKGETIYICH